MKSLYLILAAIAVAVTTESQQADSDIIWYPVDDEDGVFISTVGEKHRTPDHPKWRSHRQARYTETALPLPLSFSLSYDPTENRDPSFFHDIRDRRPLPNLPSVFRHQQRPEHRPEHNFQEIINEVFDYKRPSVSETTATSFQRPPERPSATNKPNKESDRLVFPDEITQRTTTPSDVIPTDPPTMSPCERKCPVTPEFNPVCGSDSVTYSNAGRLKCAQMCGKNVRLSHHGNCGRTPLVTPLLSNNRKQKFTRFL